MPDNRQVLTLRQISCQLEYGVSRDDAQNQKDGRGDPPQRRKQQQQPPEYVAQVGVLLTV